MKNKILYILLGVFIGAGALYGFIQKPSQPPLKPKTLSYIDIIAAPEGEYGKPVLEMAKKHTAIYEEFVQKTSQLKEGEIYTLLNPYGTVQLAALAGLRTAVPSTIELRLKVDAHTPDLIYRTKELSTEHILPVLGLLPDAANKIELTAYRADGTPLNIYQTTIQTNALPEELPKPEIIKAKAAGFHNQAYFMAAAEGSGMGPRKSYWLGFDEQARIRWSFNPKYGAASLMKPWKEGKWLALMPNELAGQHGWGTKYIISFDLVGRIYNAWYAPERLHHDFAVLKNDRVIIAADGAETLGTEEIEDVSLEGVLSEVSNNITQVRLFDLSAVLKQRPVILDNLGSSIEKIDWFHMNGVAHNAVYDYAVYSGRSQSATVAVNADHTLRWILAAHSGWPKEMQPYLLTPKGKGFEWPWGQHSPVFRDAKHLFLFDNGNFRSIEFKTALKAHENYSRLVEYKVDDKAKTIEQVWSYGKERGHELYAPYVGGVDYLPESKTVVGVFGGILKTRLGNPSDVVEGMYYKNSAHIVEVTHTMPPQLVAEYAFKDDKHTSSNGFMVYRGAVCHMYCAYELSAD